MATTWLITWNSLKANILRRLFLCAEESSEWKYEVDTLPHLAQNPDIFVESQINHKVRVKLLENCSQLSKVLLFLRSEQTANISLLLILTEFPSFQFLIKSKTESHLVRSLR